MSLPAALYVVSTPIGHLDDITQRALDTLRAVSWVAAEDTRHSQRLLNHYGIRQTLVSCHDHNEEQRSVSLVENIQRGEAGALISDAGTPLLSDPGYRLVRACQDAGVSVVPIPGASAMLAALAVAGQPTNRFVFEGFLPSKGAARQLAIARVASSSCSSIIYEAPQRVLSLLESLEELVLPDRQISLCRELTKRFETVRRGSVAEIKQWVASDDNQQRGEIVVVLSPFESSVEQLQQGDQRLARLLLKEMPISRVAKVMAAHTGLKRQDIYASLEAFSERNPHE